MIDIFVSFLSICSSVGFVIGLTLSVRRNGQTGVLNAIKQVFILVMCISGVVLWIGLGNIEFSTKVLLLFLHIVLTWALSFSYILGLFGLPLTSLRIQILLSIYKFGSSGVSLKKLDQEYSYGTIVSQRIHRLETSKEIVKKGKFYEIRSLHSYFMLHNAFLLYLVKVYAPIKSLKH